MKEESAENKILEAARIVFVRKGLESATMSDIARQAGISRTSLNYYFRTKGKLFEAIFEGILRDFWGRLGNVLGLNIPVIEKFEKIIDIHTTTILRHRELPPFLIGELDRDPKGMMETVISIFAKDEAFVKFVGQIDDEVERGILKKVPYIDIFTTYTGVMLFPFFTQKALTILFMDDSKDAFDLYIMQRRGLVLQVMKDLLLKKEKP
jgi:AcrR family transcriptional regulator